MLDTNICSFIMREHPSELLARLEWHVQHRHRIVISAITYAELRFGSIGKKAPKKLSAAVDSFVDRVNEIFPWDKSAVDATTKIKQYLATMGAPIGPNDTAIAGHALSTGSILVSNNIREFARVPDLELQDWST